MKMQRSFERGLTGSGLTKWSTRARGRRSSVRSGRRRWEPNGYVFVTNEREKKKTERHPSGNTCTARNVRNNKRLRFSGERKQ
ncbi:hypothetical protein AXF42_Ash006391 [Apostasia shenzhenica]|uniref:Uncharacterized protein n=1 Tax=Apostasia shenzhenica TaxID=1088818 RepID=A0A2I0AYX4_9ASPA|nr:hypothetical protein AXF42_Ash006391 [Apostasia shenzhenica]